MKPLILPRGKITSKYGWRINPVNGQKQLHNGIDIALPVGTPVLAPDTGRIIRVWEDDRGGKQLTIECGDYIFGFAHLSRITKQAGDIVSAGEVIAYTGNTGRTTGAHLHFTCRINGTIIDPEILYKNLNV